MDDVNPACDTPLEELVRIVDAHSRQLASVNDVHPLPTSDSDGSDLILQKLSLEESDTDSKDGTTVDQAWCTFRRIFYPLNEEPSDVEDQQDRLAKLLRHYETLEVTTRPHVLARLDFETRKSVSHIFSAMVLPDRDGFATSLADKTAVLSNLTKGYADPSTALVSDTMLGDCLKHSSVAACYLDTCPSDFEKLVRVAISNANFEIAGGAFRNIQRLLLDHRDVTVPIFEKHSDRIFTCLNQLLVKSNYVIKRQALALLVELLMDPSNYSATEKYLASRPYLKQVMLLLREQSQAVRRDAFNIFKIFVVNPRKSPGIVHILSRNKNKLIPFVQQFEHENPDAGFRREKRMVLYALETIDDDGKTTEEATFETKTACPSAAIAN